MFSFKSEKQSSIQSIVYLEVKILAILNALQLKVVFFYSFNLYFTSTLIFYTYTYEESRRSTLRAVCLKLG